MAYSEEEIKKIKDKICDIISTNTIGLHRLVKNYNDLPAVSTIMLWLANDKDFSEQYARARETQADLLADEIIEIADDTVNDSKFTENGEIENKEWINRSRLRVDARKWKASKLAPKKYGDKVDVTTGGEKIQTPIIIDWGVDNKE